MSKKVKLKKGITLNNIAYKKGDVIRVSSSIYDKLFKEACISPKVKESADDGDSTTEKDTTGPHEQ